MLIVVLILIKAQVVTGHPQIIIILSGVSISFEETGKSTGSSALSLCVTVPSCDTSGVT